MQLNLIKNLKFFVVALATFAMIGCDDGGGGGSSRRDYVGYNPNSPYLTSPNGQNCVYNNGSYRTYNSAQPPYANQFGYSSMYTTNYRSSNSRYFDPYSPYDPYGQPNAYYRNPRYANDNCQHLNSIAHSPGFQPYSIDYRALNGNFNTGCPFGYVAAGFGWGMVCVQSTFGTSAWIGGGYGSSTIGTRCGVYTDSHCTCRALTYPGLDRPNLHGVCVD